MAEEQSKGGGSGHKWSLKRYLPILEWLPQYQLSWLRPDIIAGLTVWAVMVPEAMAYAGIAGVHPIIGLYTVPIDEGRQSGDDRLRRISGGGGCLADMNLAALLVQCVEVGESPADIDPDTPAHVRPCARLDIVCIAHS